MDCDQNKIKKNSQNFQDQSVGLTGLASLLEGQAFWLFEGRIGWGSCKLPNNLSARRSTVLDIIMFPVYLDHIAELMQILPLTESHPEMLLLCYNINPDELISDIRNNKSWKFELVGDFDLPANVGTTRITYFTGWRVTVTLVKRVKEKWCLHAVWC